MTGRQRDTMVREAERIAAQPLPAAIVLACHRLALLHYSGWYDAGIRVRHQIVYGDYSVREDRWIRRVAAPREMIDAYTTLGAWAAEITGQLYSGRPQTYGDRVQSDLDYIVRAHYCDGITDDDMRHTVIHALCLAAADRHKRLWHGLYTPTAHIARLRQRNV